MNWVTFNRTEITNTDYTLQDVISGKIDGMTITNILPEQTLQTCIENINQKFTHSISEHHHSELEHDSHLGASNDFETYLKQSQSHDQNVLQKLGVNFPQLFQEIFSALSSSEVSVPTYNTISYKSCVVKIWEKGQELLPHYDAVIHESAEGQELAAMGDVQKIISFVLMLQAPDGGGELIVYDLNYEDTPKGFMPLSQAKQQFMKVYIQQQQIKTLKVKPQDNCLVIFAGGKKWHSVSPVIGSKSRMSIGGLLMPSFDNEQLYYWG